MHIIWWFLLGCMVGVLIMAARWWLVASLEPQGGGLAVLPAVAGVMWRTFLAGGLLVLGLSDGIFSGLAAFAGLEISRWGLVLAFSSLKPGWNAKFLGKGR